MSVDAGDTGGAADAGYLAPGSVLCIACGTKLGYLARRVPSTSRVLASGLTHLAPVSLFQVFLPFPRPCTPSYLAPGERVRRETSTGVTP